MRRVTAYTPSKEETDGNPWKTASGMRTKPGKTVAANFLPFGTKIRIPDFGNQIFVVEDRISHKFGKRIDVCVHSKTIALNIGNSLRRIEVLD